MVQAWLRLFRVPNLLTVPGDPLAGYMIAWASGFQAEPFRALLCVAASLCLYSFGLVSNDLVDLKEDSRERPDRPLPSGQIRPGVALAVAITLALAGVALGFVAGCWADMVAVALTLTILLYNLWGKRVPVWGPLNMGLCRGLSLLLGAAAAGSWGLRLPLVIISAVGLTLYVAAVTQIARRETVPGPVGPVRWLPGIILLLWFALFELLVPWSGPSPRLPSTVVALAAVAWSVLCAQSICGAAEPRTIAGAVGGFLRGLLLVQAALVAIVFYAGAVLAAALLLMLAASSGLAKRFYAS